MEITDFVNRSEVTLLIRLFVAHLTTDFLLQHKMLVENKKGMKWRSWWLYVHALIAGLTTYALAGYWNNFLIPVAIVVTHFIIDLIKIYQKETHQVFLKDQIAHVGVILLAWVLYISQPEGSSKVMIFEELKLWLLIATYITVIWPAGFWISKFTENLRQDTTSEGLKKGGKLIGQLERVLILTFVMLGRYDAIGFLIGAKSIFRFGDINTDNKQKNAEYILIGTLVSFAISIFGGLLVLYILRHF